MKIIGFVKNVFNDEKTNRSFGYGKILVETAAYDMPYVNGDFYAYGSVIKEYKVAGSSLDRVKDKLVAFPCDCNVSFNEYGKVIDIELM